jgi:hypothetical protein|tara:strand:- start:230 stop:409 length:180 start_codon:yes stop_codon:yes gene_type:complete
MENNEDIDIELKMGTPDEVFWTEMKEMTLKQNIQANRTLELNESILKHCEMRIEQEQKV